MLIWLLTLITSSNLGHLDPSLDSSHRRKFKAVFETLNDQSFTVLLYCSINKMDDMKKSKTINMNILNAFCQKFQINNQIIVSINHKTMSNVNTGHFIPFLKGFQYLMIIFASRLVDTDNASYCNFEVAATASTPQCCNN